MDGRIDLVFVLEEIRIYKNKSRPSFLWNYAPNSRLKKLRSTKLTILPSFDARPLWFITVTVKLQDDSVARVN